MIQIVILQVIPIMIIHQLTAKDLQIDARGKVVDWGGGVGGVSQYR